MVGMSTRHALLTLLADGAFHSGTDLGAQLGVTRAAINKAVQALQLTGLEIHCIPGRGYRLLESLDPLSTDRITGLLVSRDRSLEIEVLESTVSTSQELIGSDRDFRPGRICLAEVQLAGRGRRGRHWVASPYQNIVMSMSWRFETGPAGLAGLSLAAGTAVIKALEKLGVRGAGLKWPNDILLQGRKLAGLLVDLRGEAAGPALVVLGLGLNVAISEADANRIDQPWAMLREVLPGPIERNRLAALLIDELADTFQQFAEQGFEPYREEWERLHVYQNCPVHLDLGETRMSGTVVGIDSHGNLRLRDTRGQVRAFHSGEVSLRAAS
jgi:BirA family biotin operon repressor/biotin-[acetyl-CoA-carboxylase] ligase